MDMTEFHNQMDHLRRMREKILEKQAHEQQDVKTGLNPDIARAVEMLITLDQGPKEARKSRLDFIRYIIDKYEKTLEKLED